MNLNGRIDKLEAHAVDRKVRQAAAVLGAEVDCMPADLIARAEALADLIALVGRAEAIRIVSDRSGATPEQLEASADRLARLIA